MQQRLNFLWMLLLILTGFFGLLYLWYTFFPGSVNQEYLRYFTPEQIARGRQYNWPLQLAYFLGFGVQTLALTFLVFSKRGILLLQWIERVLRHRYWLSVILYALIIWVLLRLLSLPFSLFSGYYWQHRWGFSTQSLSLWWIDYLKQSGIQLPLYLAGIILLFLAFRCWPRTWWLLCACFLSLWLVIQTLIWPVVVTPLFNSFEPARDPQLVKTVEELGTKAGIAVSEILIMDASKRTTKTNAYFTGVGRTKRIVLYDNLVTRFSPEEVKAVIAHEMAHWRQGHITKGLLWGVGANFLIWFVFSLLAFKSHVPGTSPSPQVLALLLLFSQLVFFCGSPVENYISRQMEREADRISVELTEDPATAVSLEVNLAVRNLSDLSPAPFIEWFSYSHPSAGKRIGYILEAAGGARQ